ncbi:hypothetical protein CsSME_00016553 [Camellia sinensis var. sinensis]
MDNTVMLLCSYRSTNVAYKLKSPYTFGDLVNFVCDKFVGQTPDNFCLFFKILGYNNFQLQIDVDMQNLVHLAHSFWLQLIDVMIESRSGGSGVSDSDCVFDSPAYTWSRL